MSAPVATSCESINDNFQRETGRIALGTYRLGLYKDPYLRFVSQSAFPDGMGAIIKNTIAQRTLAVGSGWEDVGVTGVSGVTGVTGVSGVTGVTGVAGVTGVTGVPGVSGGLGVQSVL